MSRRFGAVSLTVEAKTASDPNSLQSCQPLDLHHCRKSGVSQQLRLPARASLALITWGSLHHLLRVQYDVCLWNHRRNGTSQSIFGLEGVLLVVLSVLPIGSSHRRRG